MFLSGVSSHSCVGIRSTPVLSQQHIKDPGQCAENAGGRLQLNTHRPFSQQSPSITWELIRETSSHATRQGTLVHIKLSQLAESPPRQLNGKNERVKRTETHEPISKLKKKGGVGGGGRGRGGGWGGYSSNCSHNRRRRGKGPDRQMHNWDKQERITLGHLGYISGPLSHCVCPKAKRPGITRTKLTDSHECSSESRRFRWLQFVVVVVVLIWFVAVVVVVVVLVCCCCCCCFALDIST